MPIKNLLKCCSIVIMGLAMSGCAHMMALKDSPDAYTLPQNTSVPKIALKDFTDNRSDKSSVGLISALQLKSSSPLGTVLANRTAARLKEEGFAAVKFEEIDLTDKEEFRNALQSANARAFLTGGIDNFFVTSTDALLDKARGQATFYLRLYDSKGNVIYDKPHSAVSEYYIGLGGTGGSEKAVEFTLQACVDEIFKDEEFRNLLQNMRSV